MREKLLWSIVVLLGLMLVFAQAQSPTRTESQVGRYQVVTVAGDPDTEALAFKIDTATGKTWIKARLVEGAATNIEWVVMPDYAPQRPQK